MIIIIIMISNNVPTTAPLITATLTESSLSLSLDGSYLIVGDSDDFSHCGP